jgi:hypothetical protein
MNLIISGIDDTGYAYYCSLCGSVLITDYVKNSIDIKLPYIEQELEWFFPKHLQDIYSKEPRD